VDDITMNSNNLTTEEMNELIGLRLLLNPPGPPLDEKDHIIAKCRYAFQNLTSDYIYDLLLYVAMKEGLTNIQYDYISADKIISNALSAQQYLVDCADIENQEPWDVYGFGDPQYKEVLRGAINDSHCGDCTAIATSCFRCYAEQMYNIPCSATWSKSVGSAMFYRRNTLERKLKGTD
jgi:hypothetical protein